MPNDNTNKLSLIDRLMRKDHPITNTDLVEAANTIKNLTEDLDALRRYVCWIESDPTGADFELPTTPEDVAQGRGWDCFPKKSTYCCDNCGNDVAENDAYHYAEVPWDVQSANVGESATLCAECEDHFRAIDEAIDEKYREMPREDADRNNDDCRGGFYGRHSSGAD